jgi:hypothetical protein
MEKKTENAKNSQNGMKLPTTLLVTRPATENAAVNNNAISRLLPNLGHLEPQFG